MADIHRSSLPTGQGLTLYKRLLGYAFRYRRPFAGSILAMVGLASTEWMMPWLLRDLIDHRFGAPVDRTALMIPLGVVALFCTRGVLSYAGNVGLAWVAHRVVMDFRTEMFDRVLALPVQYFHRHAAGGLISKFTFDATQVAGASTKVVNDLVKDSAVILVLVGWLLYLDRVLTLVLVCVVPPTAWAVRRVSKRLRTMSRRLQDSVSGINQITEEAISGHREVRLNGTQAEERSRFLAVARAARHGQMKVIGTAAANVPVIQLFLAVGIAVMITVAMYQGAAGEMTQGEFVAYTTATLLLIAPARRLSSVNEYLQRGLAAAESLFSLIDEPIEPETGTRDLPEGPLGIRFENVRFRYAGAETEALDGVTFEIHPGETVAIVGRSGSGKSTLLDLIPRLNCVDDGRVLVGGLDVREVSRAALRDRIAMVGQQAALFNETLAYNIAYGLSGDDPEALRERVLHAAAAAQVNAFADMLPEGLETQVGDRGTKLSGGQRQRIALARALARNAPILLLDEATSALDGVTERAVQGALEALHGKRTVVIVAHRLSTIESADRIIVMDQGRIVETGDHAGLMAAGGAYARLHAALEEVDVADADPGSDSLSQNPD